jgi:hypothetical protein
MTNSAIDTPAQIGGKRFSPSALFASLIFSTKTDIRSFSGEQSVFNP